MITPAMVLAVIVGAFNASAYVFIRGRAGARLPLLVLAAILGAWAGDAIGSRLGTDLVQVGDFHVLGATVVAWLGMGLVAVLAVLVPERQVAAGPPAVTTSVTRGGGDGSSVSEHQAPA